MKIFIRECMDKTCLALSMLPLPKGRDFGIKTERDAEIVLRNAGYEFPVLWNELKPLRDDELDVSFIIPVYNAGKYLYKCLDGIINQDTNYRYEVICVNDGSTDGSANILADYEKRYPRLRVLTQKNQGISAARNHGIEAAIGKYVGFIDNDDRVSSDYVESIMDVAVTNDADLVQTDYDEISADGTLLKSRCRPFRVYTKKEYLCHVCDFHGFIWGGVIRKRIFNKIRFPFGFWFEDIITCLLVIRLTNKIVHLDKIVYHKTAHATNASKTLWKNTNIKSVDQYWLVRSVCDYASYTLQMPMDAFTYELLLRELGAMLVSRTKGLPIRIKYAVFKLCSEYFRTLKMESYRPMFKRQQIINRALLNENYKKWFLASISAKFHK